MSERLICKTYAEVEETHESFIDVYEPIAGWKSRLMVWDEEMDFFVPWQTGFCGYATKEEAIEDAKSWASAEDMPYVDISPK